MANFDLYYEIEEDGYWIYDKNSELEIHQYEPYIPDPNKTYEENAIIQINEIMNMPIPEPIPNSNDNLFPDQSYKTGYEQALLDLIKDKKEQIIEIHNRIIKGYTNLIKLNQLEINDIPEEYQIEVENTL